MADARKDDDDREDVPAAVPLDYVSPGTGDDGWGTALGMVFLFFFVLASLVVGVAWLSITF